MKLNNKEAKGIFTITDNINKVTWNLDPRMFLTELQYETMLTRPNLILQFVRYVDNHLKNNGYTDISIKSDIIILSTPHKAYKKLKIGKNKILVDAWGLIDKG